MERKGTQTVTPALEELQRRFDAWRSAGEKGRRIPEALWESATELAKEIGVNPVVRTLHLDFVRLKRRVTGQAASKTKASPTTTGPAFIELAMDSVSRRPECVVEFDGRNGKVRMRLADHDPAAIVALAEALSRAEP